MPGPSESRWRRDGIVLLLFSEMLLMLGAGTVGAERWYAAGLALLVGTLLGWGWRHGPAMAKLLVPLVATAVFAAGLVVVFTMEDVALGDGTWLGFHPATAGLVYLVWLPAFFTTGVTFAWLMPRFEEVRV